ncbi:hypothetical protein HKCCSP123_07605 [Rhodobacterales bacterium HKCCSP123]|nr:hypothetical protein [Rhodobacterales bacterium HKCCSP123]
MSLIDHTFTDPKIALRLDWATALCFALERCDPKEAAPICAAYLETAETAGPLMGDPFGMVAGDANLWAASAPPHELIAYTLAGLNRLPKAPVTTDARRRAFKAIWRSFADQDRRAFLKAVKGGKS